jgi:hypothetical protein
MLRTVGRPLRHNFKRKEMSAYFCSSLRGAISEASPISGQPPLIACHFLCGKRKSAVFHHTATHLMYQRYITRSLYRGKRRARCEHRAVSCSARSQRSILLQRWARHLCRKLKSRAGKGSNISTRFRYSAALSRSLDLSAYQSPRSSSTDLSALSDNFEFLFVTDHGAARCLHGRMFVERVTDCDA